MLCLIPLLLLPTPNVNAQTASGSVAGGTHSASPLGAEAEMPIYVEELLEMDYSLVPEEDYSIAETIFFEELSKTYDEGEFAVYILSDDLDPDDEFRYVCMYISSEDFSNELDYLAMGNKKITADWETLVQVYVDISVDFNDLTGEKYVFQLINPQNTALILLMVFDGEVLYNAVDDLK